MNHIKLECEANYKSFLEQVRTQKHVWGLYHPDEGWAFCESNEYEETGVLVFWSEEAKAKQHAAADWSDYIPKTIDFDSFIEGCLNDVHEEEILIGPNWDSNLCGLELEPVIVVKELVESTH